MALTLIGTSELLHAADHPLGFTDVKNRAGKELADILQVEHEANGTHTTASKGIVVEAGTYTGDNSGVQVVSLTDSTLTPFLILVFEDAANHGYFRLSNQLATVSLDLIGSTGAAVTTAIIREDVGTFTVGALLDTVQTYYYMVLGTQSTVPTFTGDTGAGSDPTWIQHGAALLGGNAATMANSVEDTMYDAIDHEHVAATGVHDTLPFSWVYELGTFVGNDTDDRTITLVNTSLDIKLLLVAVGQDALNAEVLMYTESMSGDDCQTWDGTIFESDHIQSIGTGEFEVGTGANFSAYDWYSYLAIGVDV